MRTIPVREHANKREAKSGGAMPTAAGRQRLGALLPDEDETSEKGDQRQARTVLGDLNRRKAEVVTWALPGFCTQG